MDKIIGNLTVFFEKPFWVGVLERFENGTLSVTKITFGAEPKDYAVYDFILKHYSNLSFCLAVTSVVKETKKNPKRIQREIKKQLQNTGIGTKSQQALKLQQEQKKQERKTKSREQKQAEAERQFLRKQQKKKEKHKGH